MAKSLPSDYSAVAQWTLGQTPVWFSVVLSGLSFLAFFLTLSATLALASLATGVDTISLGIGGILLGLVLGLVLHEATHAVVYLAFGAHPTFGIKPWTRFGPVFYVTAPGSYLRRAGYLAVGLAPLVLLTPVLLFAAMLLPAGSITATLFAISFNVAGSVGDVLMAWKVLAYPSETYFQDTATADGFITYGRATM